MPFFRRRRRRPRVEWFGGIQVTPTVVAVNTLTNSQIIGATALEEWPNATLRKLIGTLFISPATAPAAASGYGVFLGIYRRRVVGAAALVADPEVAPEHPFIWWNCCFPQIGGTAAADSNASRWIGYFRFDIHLSVRLRMIENEELLLAVKNSASSAASIQYSFAFRGQLGTR